MPLWLSASGTILIALLFYRKKCTSELELNVSCPVKQKIPLFSGGRTYYDLFNILDKIWQLTAHSHQLSASAAIVLCGKFFMFLHMFLLD